MDYYALSVVAPGAAPALERDTTAAFETPEQRKSFEAWLRKRGIEPRIVTHGGHEFVTWSPATRGLLSEYVREKQEQCARDAGPGDAAVYRRCRGYD